MRIEQLEYVLAVARYGSLSRAASTIYVNQPTLSSSIAALEKELGQPLFRRTRRGMVLTQLGEDLMPLIQKTVNDFHAIKKHAGSGGTSLTHVHLITASPARDVFGEVIARSHDIFPMVHYYLHQAPANDVLRALAENKGSLGISVAIDYQLHRHSDYAAAFGLRFLPLYNDNLVLFCRVGGRHDELNECSYHDLPKHGTTAIPIDLVQQGAIKVQSSWSALSGHLAFSDPSTLERFVMQNDTLGITTLYSTTNNPLFANGYLKTMRLLDCPINLVHYLAYMRDHTITDEEANVIQQIESTYERMNLA